MTLLGDGFDCLAQVHQEVAGVAVVLHSASGGADLAVTAAAVEPITGNDLEGELGDETQTTARVSFRRADLANESDYESMTMDDKMWHLQYPAAAISETLITFVASRKTSVRRTRQRYHLGGR